MQRLEAMDIKGEARIGIYSRSVTFKGDILKDTAGETNNDEQVLNTQIKTDIEDINKSKDRALFDFRNKRDNFGKLERENYSLSSYDRRQLRTLAYQRPWEHNRLYFTAGRFPLPEANLIANDGAEVGYRGSKANRYGLFAGQGAKDIIRPLYVDPETRTLPSSQAGVYFAQEEKDGPEESSYMTHALAQAPSYELTATEARSYYYHQGMWTFGETDRIGSLVHYDVSPKSSLRRAYLSYFRTVDRWRAGGYFQQTSTEDYLIKQTLQDTLQPSTVRVLDLEWRYRVTQTMAMDASFARATRSADGLSRTEYALGLLFPRLLSDNTSSRLQFGKRSNYQSQDQFIKLGFDYFGKEFSLGLSHLINTQDFSNSPDNKQSISTIDAGIFLSDDIRSALAYEIEKDNKVDAKAFFLMVGYRFGSGSVSGIRTRPARFEEL